MINVEEADVEQALENDVKRRNEIAYDFVADVVRPLAFLVLTFPSMSVTSPNLILSRWVSGSKGSLVLLYVTVGYINVQTCFIFHLFFNDILTIFK